MELRHLVINGGRTSIALEPAFWEAADRLAKVGGMSWQQWAGKRLVDTQAGRASKLRVSILEEALRAR